MSDISTRHIRHDWPEWVDWNNQKTVKTMCEVRSRPGLCGIPGITNQKQVVQKNGRNVWGWCMHCVRITFPYYLPPELTREVTSDVIIDLHHSARNQLARQYYAHLSGQRVRARQENRPLMIGNLDERIAKMEADFPHLTAPS